MNPSAASAPPESRVLRVAVGTRPGHGDPRGAAALAILRETGLAGASSVRFQAVYLVETAAPAAEVERAAREFLADPVLEEFAVDGPVRPDEEVLPVLTVLRRPGVMDPAEASVRGGLRDLGIEAASVRTGRRYVLEGAVDPAAAAAAVARTLANEVVEEVHRGVALPTRVPHPAPFAFRPVTVPLRGAPDGELARISREGGLSLEVFEMRAIADHFGKVGRDPSDTELETLAQTWSEHCKHKTLTGAVTTRDPDGERSYGNLLKETIVLATEKLARPWCLSVFVDNAGVVALDDHWGVCMKVETHNHPSAIEPYGGAGTGIGGVIRDILGTGLGARPVAGTDVFCLAPPDLPDAAVPKGALHPRRVLRGVVAGVRDYGNRMGIPTVSGGLWFDERYVGNPLVFAGTVGILPRSMVEKRARKFAHVTPQVAAPQLEGPADAEVTLVGWGSTYGVIKEAIAQLAAEGITANQLGVKWIVPFHTDEISAILNRAKRVIVVENNFSGQFARYLRGETGFAAHGHIRKYDGEPFLPHHIVEGVRRQLAGETTRFVPTQEFEV